MQKRTLLQRVSDALHPTWIDMEKPEHLIACRKHRVTLARPERVLDARAIRRVMVKRTDVWCEVGQHA
jgi:hypothetical protein